MSLSIWTKLDRFPPIVCRLLARRKLASGGTVALTAQEIADGTKTLSVMDVQSLSWQPDWDTITVGVMREFLTGCGIDLTDRANMREHSAYLRRNPSFKYLEKSPEWESTYKPMIKTWLAHANRTS